MNTKIILLVSLPVLISYSVFSQNFTQVAKVVASDRAAEDLFGSSVCISGKYLIAGSTNKNSSKGQAYIYEQQSEGNWIEAKILVASDQSLNDCFGSSVSISGNYVVVGAAGDDVDVPGSYPIGEAGAAYIYERNANGNWNEVQKIVASQRADNNFFGNSVSISGNYIIVGEINASMDASESNTMYGAGAAYIFWRNDAGKWIRGQKIVASDRAAYDAFGCSVSISGDYAIVGAYAEDEDAFGSNTLTDAGAIYIFKRAVNGYWYEVQKIIPSDRTTKDHFGTSVCISGQYLIVGTYYKNDFIGAAYIFEQNNHGNWIEVQKIVASDGAIGDFFGKSVSISDDLVLVGAMNEDEDVFGINTMDEAGAAYIFNRNENGYWNEIHKILPLDRSSGDKFGDAVSISGNVAVIGALYEDENSLGQYTLDDAGSIYIFEECTISSIPDPENIIENGDFGSCSISPWVLYVQNYLGVYANASLIDGCCTVDIFSLADETQSWHVQPTQELSTSQLNRLEKGATYTISFDAYAESDNRQCTVVLGQNEDQYTTVFEKSILLGTEIETYSYDFILDQKFSKMKFSFDIGKETSAFTFDNVRLVKKWVDSDNDGIEDHIDNCPYNSNSNQADFDNDGIGDACESSVTGMSDNYKDNSCRVYPNPASDVIKITTMEPATITIFNSIGVPVKILTNAGDNKIIPVDELPNGLYFIEIRIENSVTVKQIIIQH